ncbi:heparan-alpha-glucosaminide N-acetyltransferase domain-containing protein [Agromyces larvae]|uniref:DUF418 domain-containing protein n=1 Tax=Agromyces larvae TaxID=2929802 RepID=A0ABY4C2X1_9MICO|nr:heparan-alpha-glucosaminide N-acetyltransferase domain-containing protein [Agromyces larvae]UOE44323.1 DUF418 domain-containing protein [Agromyces larvae]
MPRASASNAGPETSGHPLVPLPRRIDGVDIARGLALVGMFVAHVAPPAATAEAAALIAIADERPRLLFALCAGFGLGFLTGGTRPVPAGPGGARRRLRVQLAIRGLILIVLGLVITGGLRPLVFVILDVYGVAFLLMLPLLFLRPWVMLAVGSALLAVAPGLAVLASRTQWVADARAAGWALPVDWFVSGAYPVVEWVPIMLIGLGLARLGATRPTVVAWTAGVGASVMLLLLAPATALLDRSSALDGALAGAASAAQADAMHAEALYSAALGESLRAVANVGFAALVVAVAVWLTALTWPRVRQVAGLVLSPFAAMGSMPLTIYTAHLVVIAGSIRVEDGRLTDDSWPLLIGLIAGSMVFALLWRRFVGRGPLEEAIRLASGRARVR